MSTTGGNEGEGPTVVPRPSPSPSPSSSSSSPAPASQAPARKVRGDLPSAETREARGKEIIEKAKAIFPGELSEEGARPGVLTRLVLPPSAVLRVCTWLRDQGTFDHCALVGATDWRETREVFYLLWSDALHNYVELSTRVPAEDPHLESVSSVWFGASWHEREAWDLVGIRFDHHPDLRRLFLPEGYQFHPLLKTFELHEPEELEVKARLGR